MPTASSPTVRSPETRRTPRATAEPLLNSAIEKFRKALTIDPNYQAALDGLGEALTELAEIKEAREAQPL